MPAKRPEGFLTRHVPIPALRTTLWRSARRRVVVSRGYALNEYTYRQPEPGRGITRRRCARCITGGQDGTALG